MWKGCGLGGIVNFRLMHEPGGMAHCNTQKKIKIFLDEKQKSHYNQNDVF